ncbi:MAG: hypothetical protein ACK44A_16230, partial [Roseateles sp.]
DLMALRRHHPRWRLTARWPLRLAWASQLPCTEQTRLGLFALVPDRRSTHALLNARRARFVHTF